MAKFVCSVCGYVYEGDAAQNNVQYDKFKEQKQVK